MGSSSLRVAPRKKTHVSACGLKVHKSFSRTGSMRAMVRPGTHEARSRFSCTKPLSRHIRIETNDGKNVTKLAGLWLAITKMTFSHVFGTSSDMRDQALLLDKCRGKPASKVGLNKCQVTGRFAKIHQVSNWGRWRHSNNTKKYGPFNRVLAAYITSRW